MNEFRRDPHSGEWVIIASSRQERPALPDVCPFCVGGLEAPQPYSVKAFENRWPVMQPIDSGSTESLVSALRSSPEQWISRPSESMTLHASERAIGAAEVILYTPEHEGSLGTLSPEQLESVWDLWIERTRDLASRDEIASVLIFENRGQEVGVTIHHPHCQIYAFPFLPPRQRHEMNLLRSASEHGVVCTTCQLIEVESSSERLIDETESAIAYAPYASAWPVAAHLVPKRHLGSMTELVESESRELRQLLSRVIDAGDRIFGRSLPTMTAILQCPVDNSDPDGLWHMRIEVVSPMRKKDTLRYVAAAEVSTGTYANPVTPEQAAALWRQALLHER